MILTDGFSERRRRWQRGPTDEPIRERYERLLGLFADIEKADLRIHRVHWDRGDDRGYPADVRLIVRGVAAHGERRVLDQWARVSIDRVGQRWAITSEEVTARELVSAAAGGTASGIEAMPEILANSHLNGLKVDLTRLEQRFEQESTVLGEKHPQFQRTKAEIQTLKDKIAGEVKRVVASLGNAVETAKKREAELKAAVEQQNARVINMKDARIELASMSADVANAQRSYDAVLARYMTNKIESSAKSTNVALLTPAIEPLEPAQPKVGLISALAVVIGAMLAAAVVFVLESMDRRVRTRADLETRLAVPSLGRLSRWQPTGGRLLPAPATASPARALPQPW